MDQTRKDDRALLWMFDAKKDKKHDRMPDFSGPGRIHKDVLKDFVESFKELGDGETLKLRCAGWVKEGKNGKYTFITIEPDRPKPTQEVSSEDVPF